MIGAKKKRKSAERAGEAERKKNVFLVKISVFVLTIFYGNAILTLSVKNILSQAGSKRFAGGKERGEK